MAGFTRDNSTQIVTDSKTELQWQDDSTPASMLWTPAIDYCEALTLGGYSDWRLPNIKELISLVDDSKISLSIDTEVFANTVSDHYWSSTTNAGYVINAWDVYFDNGFLGNDDKSVYGYVRCVRAGQ